MVEVWMLFTLIIPFLEVIFQSYVDYLYKKIHPEEEETSLPSAVGGKRPQPQREIIDFWKLPDDPPATCNR
jgi:hypothetical protein